MGKSSPRRRLAAPPDFIRYKLCGDKTTGFFDPFGKQQSIKKMTR